VVVVSRRHVLARRRPAGEMGRRVLLKAVAARRRAGRAAERAYRALLLAWAAATLLGFLYAMANPFGVPW
jgi:hypothetical protein